MSMKMRTKSGFTLEIPDFRSTEEAMLWGSRQKPEALPLVREIYRAFEKIARETTCLAQKITAATQAQLIREAAEMIP